MNPARMINGIAVTLSPYPPSFGNNPWIYGAALASVLCIAVFAMIICCWMVRDTWRFRFIDHPTSIAALFRFMMGGVALAAFVRSAPEVVYMTCFGDPDISPSFLSGALLVKRIFDIFALPMVTLWMAILVSIYPFLMLILRSRVTHTMHVDIASVWPRLVRALLIFVVVAIIAALMAVTKGYGLGQ